MSIAGALILAWLAFVVGLIAGLWLAKSAPVCGCGDVDCGGSCIDWERAS